MKEYIHSTRQVIYNAENAVKECLKIILEPFGEVGLDLNYRPDDSYSVISEYRPNEFHKVEWVRVNYGCLEMLLENDKEWKHLGFVDWAFLLDEVERAIDCETGK